MDRPLKILLIEDNPGDAFLIKFYLEESIFKDAHLIHAEYLRSGIDLLSKNEIDVILLDLKLPDSDGIETVQKVLGESDGAVVIVLTGITDEDLGVETVKMGAQDFLVKGQFDGKVLTSSIRYAFERAQLQKQVQACAVQLDESSHKFTAAQQIAHFGYWELNLKDSKMEFTEELFKLLKVENRKRFGGLLNDLVELVHPEDAGKLSDEFKMGIEKGKPFNVNFRLKHENGTYVCAARAEKNEKKEPVKLVGTIQLMP